MFIIQSEIIMYSRCRRSVSPKAWSETDCCCGSVKGSNHSLPLSTSSSFLPFSFHIPTTNPLPPPSSQSSIGFSWQRRPIAFNSRLFNKKKIANDLNVSNLWHNNTRCFNIGKEEVVACEGVTLSFLLALTQQDFFKLRFPAVRYFTPITSRTNFY